MPNLDSLPVEVLVTIGSELGSQHHLNSLVKTSHSLYRSLNNELYRRDAHLKDMSALKWARKHGATTTAQMSADAATGYEYRLANLHEALVAAAESGQTGLVSCLVQQEGVDPNIKVGVWWAYTALEAAVSQGYPDVVKVLLSTKGIDPTSLNWDGGNLLSSAVASGQSAMVEMVLDIPGIDPGHPSSRGYTPLHRAVSQESAELVACFLRRPGLRVNINAAEKLNGNFFCHQGRTALTTAADKKLPDILKLLLAAPGIDMNKGDARGYTALHIAVAAGSTDIVRLLLEYGADPDPRDNDEETPLS